MIVQRLDVGEDTHGIWLVTHHHHVIHFYQTITLSHFPVVIIKHTQQRVKLKACNYFQDSFAALI